MKKAALHNLGCKVNEYELEKMAEDLRSHGFAIVPFAPGADVYVINTCTVTNIADRKSRQMLHKAKKMNPSAVVAAAGCYVDVRKEELRKDPAIDLVLTNEEKKHIAETILAYLRSEQEKETVIRENFREDEKRPAHPEGVRTHTRAFVKIQDGCNQFCTYCIIPFARGPVRSFPEEDILRDVRTLAEQGIKEIVLTGIHISSYGTEKENGEKRLAWRPTDTLPPLYGLIEKIHEIRGIERIRLGSLEPRIMTEAFTKALAMLPKICPQFHLSLQSGCDETLRRMNRHYTTEEYAAITERIRRYFPDAAVTTDIIVGFPGETEEEFEETRRFAERIGFAKTHIFRYSKREGTIAARRTDQIPETVKEQRSDILLALNSDAEKRFAKRFEGRTVSVLFEEKRLTEGKMLWMGHTEEYIEVRLLAEEGERDLGNTILECVFSGIRDGYVLCRPANDGTEVSDGN